MVLFGNTMVTMAKTSTHIRVMVKDLVELKSIKDRLSKEWERKASYPDAIRFLIREYQRNYGGTDEQSKKS